MCRQGMVLCVETESTPSDEILVLVVTIIMPFLCRRPHVFPLFV